MQALGLTGRLGVAASARLCSDGSGALDRGGVALDRATQHAWVCQRTVPTRHGARELEVMRISIFQLQSFLPLRYLALSYDHEHNN
jgi:hypothetical protein